MFFSLLSLNLLSVDALPQWLSTVQEKLQQKLQDGKQKVQQTAQIAQQEIQDIVNRGRQVAAQASQIPINQMPQISKNIVAGLAQELGVGVEKVLEYVGLAEKEPETFAEAFFRNVRKAGENIGVIKKKQSQYERIMIALGVKQQDPTLFERIGIQKKYDNAAQKISGGINYVQNAASDAWDYIRGSEQSQPQKANIWQSSPAQNSEGFRFFGR